MKRALVACLVVAACGDNQQPVEIDVPYGAAAFVGYKANGAWHDAKPTERGYRIDTVGPYQFVFVCATDQDFDVEELFADASDGDQVLVASSAIDPCVEPHEQVASGHITGTVAQPGTVRVGELGQEGLASDWTYDLVVPQGREDLLFVPETGLTPVIRRDLEIGGGANPQPRIDLVTEGITLERAPLTVNGSLDGANIIATTVLVTANGTELPLLASATPLLLPAAELRAGERQYVDVSIDEPANGGDYNDFVELAADGDLVAQIQPPPAVTYSATDLALAATWDRAPTDAVGYQLLVANPGNRSIVHGFATATVATTRTLDLSVDRDAPGFLDAWRPLWSRDLDSSARTFEVAASRDCDCYETLLIDRGRTTAFTSPRSRCALLR